MKVLKSDWCIKLSEENVEALLCVKVEGPKIKEFIEEHSSDAAVFWWDAKELPFLKEAVMNIKAILFSTLVAVR